MHGMQMHLLLKEGCVQEKTLCQCCLTKPHTEYFSSNHPHYSSLQRFRHRLPPSALLERRNRSLNIRLLIAYLSSITLHDFQLSQTNYQLVKWRNLPSCPALLQSALLYTTSHYTTPCSITLHYHSHKMSGVFSVILHPPSSSLFPHSSSCSSHASSHPKASIGNRDNPSFRVRFESRRQMSPLRTYYVPCMKHAQ